MCAVTAAVAAGMVMFGSQRVPFGLPPLAWAMLRGVVLLVGFVALVGATGLFGDPGSRDAYQKAILVLLVPQLVVFVVFNDATGISRRGKVPGQ